MRVCHPGPPRRKYLTTSGSSLNVTDCFGLSDRGRPIALATALRNSSLLTRFPPMCGIARAKSSSVHSGFSSSAKFLFKISFLAGIGLPHRNYATRTLTLRPHHANQTLAEHAKGPYAHLAIV